MMIIPAKFKLAAIVSVAVISVSAGAVGSSQQEAKPGIILSDSQLTPIVGNTDQRGSYSSSGGSMLLGSDESEWLEGVRGVLERGPGSGSVSRPAFHRAVRVGRIMNVVPAIATITSGRAETTMFAIEARRFGVH